MVKALDSQSRVPELKTIGWLQGRLRLPGISGNLVVESKLSSGSGSVALRQSNPIHEEEA